MDVWTFWTFGRLQAIMFCDQYDNITQHNTEIIIIWTFGRLDVWTFWTFGRFIRCATNGEKPRDAWTMKPDLAYYLIQAREESRHADMITDGEGIRATPLVNLSSSSTQQQKNM